MHSKEAIKATYTLIGMSSNGSPVYRSQYVTGNHKTSYYLIKDHRENFKKIWKIVNSFEHENQESLILSSKQCKDECADDCNEWNVELDDLTYSSTYSDMLIPSMKD